MNVDVGSFTKISGPTTGNQDIVIPRDMTAAAAGTWAIIFWTAGSDQASGTWDAGYESCIGFTTGAVNSFSKSATSTDAVATASCSRESEAFCIDLVAIGGVEKQASFVSFPDSSHMRLNWVVNTNDALFNTIVINYMVLSGLTGAKVINWTSPATAIDKIVTGVGFSPDLVLSSIYNSSGDAQNTIGLMNKHGQQWANGFYGTNGNPSNTSRGQQTDATLYSVGYNDSNTVQTHFKSMDADGFTVNFSAVNPNESSSISLCLKGLSSKIGAFTAPVAPASQVIDTRQGFIPKGALFSGIGLFSTSAPAAGAVWSLGATDLTNHRAVALVDVDNVSPTQVKSVGYSDKDIIAGGNVTIVVGTSPRSVAITSNGAYAYIVTTNNVSVIRTSDNTVTATVAVGTGPRGLAITPDGAYAYVTNYNTNNVSVIRTSDNTIVATVSVGTGPYAVAITPDGSYAYVTNYTSNNVSVIRTSDNTSIYTLDAGSVSAASLTQTTINWTTKDAVAREYLYMLLGDAGVDTFPAKVDV